MFEQEAQKMRDEKIVFGMNLAFRVILFPVDGMGLFFLSAQLRNVLHTVFRICMRGSHGVGNSMSNELLAFFGFVQT